MEETQSGDQSSNPPAVRPNLEQMGRPTGHLQESDQSTPQIRIHYRTDVRHPALPSQLPMSTFATIPQTERAYPLVLPQYQWRDLLNPGLPLTNFENTLSGVLQSKTEMEKIEGLHEAELQCVIDVLGTVRALFNFASTVPHLLTSRLSPSTWRPEM